MIYSLFIHLFYAGIKLASLWNPKAKAWINGRKNWENTLSKGFPLRSTQKRIWIHCASLGEFEQGRPVIEAIRQSYPEAKILLSFFSPSGYEIRKNYAAVDMVCYLPLDTMRNATRFLALVNPDLVIFVKYEYWPNFYKAIGQKQIPFIHISSVFRPNYLFFKWYGWQWRNMLTKIDRIFIQDKSSANLLDSIQLSNYVWAGDTRYDRVVAIRDQFTPIPEIEAFCQNKKIIVIGSSWEPDEQILSKLATSIPDLHFVMAPHEIHEQHLQKIERLFDNSIRFSQYIKEPNDARVLIIDNIGLLSKLYHYATCCYIGGGFGVGIHNTLEAAAHGKPVIFGPNYKKFVEAIELIEKGGGFSIQNANELQSLVNKLLHDETFRSSAAHAAYQLVEQNSGATKKIMHYIQEKRLLTN